MSRSPKLDEIRIRGNLPPDLHSSFLAWVYDNYMPSQQQEMFDIFADTGEYPEEFISWWRTLS